MRVFIFLVTLVTFSSLKAQPKKNEKSFDAKVKIILFTNDTLYGTANIKKAHTWNHFKHTAISDIFYFKDGSTGKEEKYKPSQVKGFIITTYDGKDATFFSSTIFPNFKLPKAGILDDRDAFLHLIYDGKLSVYRNYSNTASYAGKNFVQTYQEIDYLVNENKEVFTVPLMASWKKRIKEFLGNCATLIEKIDREFYTDRHLIKIAEEYNSTCGK